MNAIKYFLFTFLISSASFAQNSAVKVINYDEYKHLVSENKNFLVVNFWATWCKPCVEELPNFMEINDKYKSNPKFKMILVSLDSAKKRETVEKYIKDNKLDVEVYLLNDPKRMNEWIPGIDESWSGAIPATIFYKDNSTFLFHEMQLAKNALESIIIPNIQ